MPDMPESPDATPLGTVLCPSGRLTICDWVTMGDWRPASRRSSHRCTEGPRVTIQDDVRGIRAAVIDGLRPDRMTRDLELMKLQEKMFAVDLRPHTEQWRVLERLRQSKTGSIEIEPDDSRFIMFDADFGHHLCFIGADLDASGCLLRVAVDLERDPFD